MSFCVLCSLIFCFVCSASEDFTYKLTQSTGTYEFWTTPPSVKVFKDGDVPTKTGSSVKVYCAKNEFEPFIVVVKPTSSGNFPVTLPTFSNPNIEMELFEVKYIHVTTKSDDLGCDNCDWPDALWPISSGDSISLVAGENRYVWVNIYVPSTGVNSGDYSGNINIAGVDIPVDLHVFNFAIPSELHVKSQMNFGFDIMLTKYSVPGTGTTEYWMYVNNLKKWWMDHRMTPKSALWPGGLNPSCCAEYDCNTQTISDPNGVWGFETPQKDVLKDGIDGVVFPSYMFMTFQNNDASQDQRPSTWCSQSKGSGDWMVAGLDPRKIELSSMSLYNQKWFEYMKSLQSYLDGFSLLKTAYYYAWNEPQDQADYDAVAWYSSLLKKFAPNIKLMCSEEPKSEIFANPTYKYGKVDIWLPVINKFKPETSFSRKAYCGESTWVYFLHGTVPPMMNPITLDHQALEGKLLGWLIWKYRVEGIAYYATNSFKDVADNPFTKPKPDLPNYNNGNLFLMYPPSTSNTNIAYGSNNHRFVPSIRFEMMRDGLEDYEYLYLLNGGHQPSVSNQGTNADKVSQKLVSSLNSYVRDDEFAYNLRKEIGLFLGGENGVTLQDILDLERGPPNTRGEGPPSNYYINFQELAGEPTDNPLIVDGKTYTKMGWSLYSDAAGAGWFGEMGAVLYKWLGGDELEGSIVYDNNGRLKTFQYVVPNGCYDVTVSIGWAGKNYLKNYIAVNNIVFFDGVNNAGGYLQKKLEVCVVDYMITMSMGILNEYTMLNYMKIETNGGGGSVSFSPVSYSEPPADDLYCQTYSMGNGIDDDNFFEVDKNGDKASSAMSGGGAFGVTFGVGVGTLGLFFCLICVCCVVGLLVLSGLLFLVLLALGVAGAGGVAIWKKDIIIDKLQELRWSQAHLTQKF